MAVANPSAHGAVVPAMADSVLGLWFRVIGGRAPIGIIDWCHK
jgi:hypothetical protein